MESRAVFFRVSAVWKRISCEPSTDPWLWELLVVYSTGTVITWKFGRVNLQKKEKFPQLRKNIKRIKLILIFRGVWKKILTFSTNVRECPSHPLFRWSGFFFEMDFSFPFVFQAKYPKLRWTVNGVLLGMFFGPVQEVIPPKNQGCVGGGS